MMVRRALTLALTCGLLSSPTWADRMTRSVDQEGNPKITIRGIEKPQPSPHAASPQAQKEFQVYELDGEGAPPTEAPPAAPQIVIIPSPPPIAPNPAAFGFGFGFGFPGFWPVCPPGSNFPPGRPLNYQNPPVNYQNPPVNYQNPPVNYQPRVLPPPHQPRRWR